MNQIEENIANRKKAELIFKTMIDVTRNDFKSLSEHGRKCFIQIAFEYFTKKAAAIPQEIPEKKHELPKPETKNNDDAKEAIESLEEIIEMCEDIPENGEEFAESVADNCRSMIEAIQNFNRVTKFQWNAIENWRSGVERWLT